MDYVIYIVCDILLGFVPQAVGCAVCLFAITKQPLKSNSFWITSAIFSGIAVVVRLICSFGLIEFGFHTVLIWMLFVVVAIAYNKLPIMQSTISIVISGALILVAELLTGGIMSVAFGMERFNEIMNYDITKNTVQEATLRAVCGIPMNVLFAVIALVFCLLLKKYREKKAATAQNEQEAQ